MTPYYDLNQLSYIPLLNGDEHDQPYGSAPTISSDCFPMYYKHTPQAQAAIITNSYQEINTDHKIIRESLIINEDDQQQASKWMSSNMKIVRKMIEPKPKRSTKQVRKQQLEESSQKTNLANKTTTDGIVRVCSDCNTTKTPLWRSGPSGPKTLCNACGIRQRKARRARAAAAAESVGLIPTSIKTSENNNNKINKKADKKVDKKADTVDNDRTIPFKKRCRFSAANTAAASPAQKKKKLCLDDIVIRLSKSSAFHRVFPQDEKDAAILLMAISCGLMCR